LKTVFPPIYEQNFYRLPSSIESMFVSKKLRTELSIFLLHVNKDNITGTFKVFICLVVNRLYPTDRHFALGYVYFFFKCVALWNWRSAIVGFKQSHRTFPCHIHAL